MVIERAMKKNTYRQIPKIHRSKRSTFALLLWTHMQLVRLHGEVLPVKHRQCLRFQTKDWSFHLKPSMKHFLSPQNNPRPTPWNSFLTLHSYNIQLILSLAPAGFKCMCVFVWTRACISQQDQTISNRCELRREQDCLSRGVSL